MKYRTRFASSLLFGAFLLAAESRITFSELPAAVQATARKESTGATVRGYSKVKENGKTIYEVALVANGKTRDISIDATGNVIEVEQQVDFDSLPEPVRAGLLQAAGDRKIRKVETVTGATGTSYEAAVAGAGKSQEIAVDAQGKARRPD